MENADRPTRVVALATSAWIVHLSEKADQRLGVERGASECAARREPHPRVDGQLRPLMQVRTPPLFQEGGDPGGQELR
jgi:hypothetical protein